MGVVPPQVQDPALALVEPHEVPLCPAFQPIQVTLVVVIECSVHVGHWITPVTAQKGHGNFSPYLKAL